MKNKFIQFRILVVGFLFFAALAVIGGKAVQLQVYQGGWLLAKANDQYFKSFQTVGKRGTIYDRNGNELAVSTRVTSIAARPAGLKQDRNAYRKLAGALNRSPKSVQRVIKAKKPFVWLKRKATPKETEAVKALQLPGIEFVSEYNRFYPKTTLAAQALGFTGLDANGLEGIEFYYDRYLSGSNRQVEIFRDALGDGFKKDSTAADGHGGGNLYLTIDQTIQYIAEKALTEVVDRHKARAGIAIVMRPDTGEILAMAQAPLFNPNAHPRIKKSLWRNRAITDQFEPGSTMKIFSAAAALESAGIHPNDIFYCENGAYRIGRNVVHDTKKHGWLSLQQIVKFSSNIGAVKISEKIGPQRLHRILNQFGFGQKTGFDSPGETPGSLADYSHWSDIDTAAVAFGHGISVSALQLVSAVSAIANNGVLMKPHVVARITNAEGKTVKRFEPQTVRRVISAGTAQLVKDILKTVMTEGGTGTNAALEGYSACGKTGTARKLDNTGRYSNKHHIASFVGFAPADRPAISVLVVVDEPQGNYYGGVVAAPAFKRIAEESLHYLGVPPESGAIKFRVSVGTGVIG
jgi:cell division protein FtsI (penicillin-binding protein 3)